MRISVGAQTASKPPCVWRVLVLPDGTLVSADSDGAVQFWDGRFGTLLQVRAGAGLCCRAQSDVQGHVRCGCSASQPTQQMF